MASTASPTAFCPRRIKGRSSARRAPVANVERADKTTRHPAAQAPADGDARPIAPRTRPGRRTPSSRRSPTTNSRSACRRLSPELADLSQEIESDAGDVRPERRLAGDEGVRAELSAGAAAGRARRAVRAGHDPGGNGDRWDQHTDLKDGHQKNAHSVDQPITASADGPARRGLLDETLVVWGGRVRPHSLCPGLERPRPQPVRLHDLDGGRRGEGRHGLRIDRRVRLPRDREQARDARPARHDAALCSASTTPS